MLSYIIILPHDNIFVTIIILLYLKMLILSDFVDFESKVGYFNNYKLVMSQYIIQMPPPPSGILRSKALPIAKKRLQRPRGARGCWVVTSQSDTCIISV